jgi:putative membrane protein
VNYRVFFLLLALLAWIGLLATDHGFLFLETTILLISAVYILGLTRLWRSAGFGHGVPAWRAACFLAGMAILALALSGPMDELADQAFSIHMVQHMLLVKVIAPLLLLGEFAPVFLWAAGRGIAQRIGKSWARSRWLKGAWEQITKPWITWGIFALCLWIWHVPTFYQAALESELLHDVEHFMFLGAALLFWWFLLQKGPDRKIRYGMAVLYLFTTLMQESALGGLLTFSSHGWYSFYASPGLWGLSPLGDQQLAGVIMWLPGGVLFLFLMVFYFGLWLQAIERSMPVRATWIGADRRSK